MSIVKLAKDGYGQLELNQVAFRRDGRIEAQCKLDDSEFAPKGTAVAENGMLFSIDNVTRTLKKATSALAATTVIGINYSTEHMYDERKNSLKDFYLTGGENFLPRIGILDSGDKFTTNTICYDSDTYADLEAVQGKLEGSTPVYAGIASDGSGYWQLFEAAPTAGPVGRVVEVGTMPDGQPGLKIQIIKAEGVA